METACFSQTSKSADLAQAALIAAARRPVFAVDYHRTAAAIRLGNGIDSHNSLTEPFRVQYDEFPTATLDGTALLEPAQQFVHARSGDANHPGQLLLGERELDDGGPVGHCAMALSKL